MPREGRPWDRVDRTGFVFAAGYAVLIVAVFAVTRMVPPSGLGVEALPFQLLTLPWSGLIPRLSVPGVPWTETAALIVFFAGLIVNTAAMYIIGSWVHRVWSALRKENGNRGH